MNRLSSASTARKGSARVAVPQPMARIGTHPESEIVLAGPVVAKRAIYLHATADGIYALNLDLEDAKLDERGRWLTDTEPLVVGPFRLTVRAASGRIAPPTMADLVAPLTGSLPIPVVGVYCGRLLKDQTPISVPAQHPGPAAAVFATAARPQGVVISLRLILAQVPTMVHRFIEQ